MSRYAPEAVEHIRRNLARPLKPYRKLAKAILADTTGWDNAVAEGKARREKK